MVCYPAEKGRGIGIRKVPVVIEDVFSGRGESICGGVDHLLEEEVAGEEGCLVD